MRDRDTDWKGLKALLEQLTDLKPQTTTVGVQGEEGRAMHLSVPALNVAQLAAAHEFGTDRIPSRPFLRRCADLYRDPTTAGKPRRAVRKSIASLLTGDGSADSVTKTMGEAYKALVLESLDTTERWAAPLHPKTVASKGHSQPLYETGQLRRSISYLVNKRGGSQ